MKGLVQMLAILALFSTRGMAAFTRDYLIWDPVTSTRNSGPEIDASLKALGYCGDYAPVTATELLANYTPFQQYAAIYICFGIYPDNYVFGNQANDANVDSDLLNYLSFTNPPDTPHIYIEGGDTWCYDPTYQIRPMLRVGTCDDGKHDLDVLSGISGTCMENFNFQYSGEKQYIDRLVKVSAGSPPDTTKYLFENGPDSVYFCSVGFQSPVRQYISIASSFEFGGVDSTYQLALMDTIMSYFFERDPGTATMDVSALSVAEPTSFSVPSVPLFPKIRVKNNGTSSATFDAHCFISSPIYNSQVTVSNLPPGMDSIIQFPTPWTPGSPCFSSDITMWVEFAGDQNSCNDTTRSSTISWNATWVLNSPFAPTPPSVDGIISASDRANAESLDVSDILGRGGTGSRNCNSGWFYVKNDSYYVYLALDSRLDVIFEKYDNLTLFFDDNNDNTFESDSSEGKVLLQADSSLPSWPDAIQYFPYYPCMGPTGYTASPPLQGGVHFGGGHVQCELKIPINTGGADPEINANIGDTVGLWFLGGDYYNFIGRVISWWPTTSSFNYGAACPDPSMMGDLILGTGGAIRDMGVVSIDVPGDTVCNGDCYVPQVTVENFGGVPDSFNVVLSITGGTLNYADTQRIFLSSGQLAVVFDTVCFPPDSGVYYALTVCTELPGDGDPNNDCDGNSIYAGPECQFFHDVGVTAVNPIIVPPDTCISIGDTVYVDVTVENQSPYFSESFNVTCRTVPLAPGGYNPPPMSINNLPPNNSTSFMFSPPWFVTVETLCYDVIVKVVNVNGDNNRTNDSLVVRVCGCEVGIEESSGEVLLPTVYSLYQSKPNPMSGKTEIRFDLPVEEEMELSLYDITGRLVANLLQGKVKAGYHKALWDGRDSEGRFVRNGVYFYRLKAEDFVITRKLVILR